ncbi:MAG: S9 family peptidase [Bacillota bacterium]
MNKLPVSTTQDYYRMNYIGAADYRPDLGLLCYTVSRPMKGKDHVAQEIILRDLQTGGERKITAGGEQEADPAFSPDGSRMLFLSDASGTRQLYIWERESDHVRKLTSLRHGVYNPVWSPHGDRIAFLSDRAVGETPAPLLGELSREEVARLAAEQARRPVVITDYGYKSDKAKGFAAKQTTHLWLVNLADGKVECLTDGERDHVMPVWFPAGDKILITSNRCRKREESIAMDLFAVDPTSKEITRLTADYWIAYYPAAFQPLFSPDGKTLVFGALAPSLSVGVPRTTLYRMDVETGKAENIWPKDAPCHEATCFLYNCENYGGGLGNACISADNRYLYFVSGMNGSANIYRAALTGEPEIVAVTQEKAAYRSVRTVSLTELLVQRGDFLQTPQLYLLDLTSGKLTQLTDSNPWLREMALSQPEEMWIDTLDGDGRVHGWAFPPQRREEGRKYPAILYIHGGPTPFYGTALTYEHQAITGAGFALILCNPRGSGGYGDKHQNMTQAYDGTAMYDLLQFVDEAVKRFPWIDGERLGVTGGSYGGFMTNWIVSHTKRFKAAVTQRSIANKMISYASSDMAGSSKGYACFEDFMLQQVKESPVAYAERIDIPFLILHGMQDMRCPVEHAHQLFTAVKDTHPDLPVRMVLFPGCNHDLPMGGPMRLRIAHYDHMIEWFKKHL